MTTQLQVDLSGLNYSLSQLIAVLNVDAATIIKTEAGQLAAQIANQLPPKNQRKGDKSTERGLKGQFFPLRSKKGVPIDPFEGSQAGRGDLRWLFGYKDKRNKYSALVGAKPADVRLTASAAQLAKMRSEPFRGAAWKDLGAFDRTTLDKKGRARYQTSRGKQHFIHINRIVVAASAFNNLLATSRARVGELKASFAYAAKQLVGKEFPDWIARHFSAVAGKKSVFDASNLSHPNNPTVTIGSRARGVISNEKVSRVIHGAVKYRAKLMGEKVKKVLSGYAYDKKTGQTFKPKAGQVLTESVVFAE